MADPLKGFSSYLPAFVTRFLGSESSLPPELKPVPQKPDLAAPLNPEAQAELQKIASNPENLQKLGVSPDGHLMISGEQRKQEAWGTMCKSMQKLWGQLEKGPDKSVLVNPANIQKSIQFLKTQEFALLPPDLQKEFLSRVTLPASDQILTGMNAMTSSERVQLAIKTQTPIYARKLLAEGKALEASRQFEKAILFNPENPNLHFEAASALRSASDQETNLQVKAVLEAELVEHLDILLVSKPEHAEALQLKSQVLFEEARNTKLLADQESNPQIKNRLYVDSLISLDKSLKINPGDWRALKLQGDILLQLGKGNESKVAYEAAWRSAHEAFKSVLSRVPTYVEGSNAEEQAANLAEGEKTAAAVKQFLDEIQSIPIEKPELKFQQMFCARAYHEAVYRMEKSCIPIGVPMVDSNPEYKAYTDKLTTLRTNVDVAHGKILELSQQIRGSLTLPEGQAPSLEQIQSAKLLIQIDKQVRVLPQSPLSAGTADKSLIQDLDLCSKLFEKVPREMMPRQELLQAFTDILKEHLDLRNQLTDPLHPIRFPLNATELTEKMRSLKDRILERADYISAREAHENISELLDRVIDLNDDKSISLLGGKEIENYAQTCAAGLDKIDQAQKLQDPKEKRTALLGVLNEFIQLRSTRNAERLIVLLQQSVANSSDSEKLQVHIAINNAFKDTGLENEDTLKEQGREVVTHLLSNLPSDSSQKIQSLILAKSFLEAFPDNTMSGIMEDAAKISLIKTQLRDVQKGFVLELSAANLGASTLTSNERLERVGFCIQIDQALLKGEVEKAAKDDDVKENFGKLAISSLAFYRESISKATGASPEKQLEELGQLASLAAAYTPLTQGKDPILNSLAFIPTCSLIESDLNLQVMGLLAQPDDAPELQKQIAGEVINDFSFKLHKSIEEGKPDWAASLNVVSLKQFVDYAQSAHLLLAQGKESKGSEAIKFYNQSALLFTQLGLTERVSQALQPVADAANQLQNPSQKINLLFGVANLYQQAGMKTEAGQVFDSLIALDVAGASKDVHDIAQLASALKQMNLGDLDQAKTCLRTLSDNPQAKALVENIEKAQIQHRMALRLNVLKAAILAEHQGKYAGAAQASLDEITAMVMKGKAGIYEGARARFFGFMVETGPGWRLDGYLGGTENNISDQDLAKSTLKLAQWFVKEGKYSTAAQIASLISEDIYVGAEAKKLIEEDIPSSAKWDGILNAGHGLLYFTPLAPAVAFADVSSPATIGEENGDTHALNALKGVAMNAATTIVPFGIARWARVGAEAAFVARAATLIENPAALKIAGFVVGTSTEAGAFTLSNMTLQSMMTGSTANWNIKNFGKEFGSMMVTFVLLHGVSTEMGKLGKKLEGAGKLDTRLGKTTFETASWGVRVGSFTATEYINESIGLKEHENVPFWMRLLSSAITDAQMIKAGKVVDILSGGKISKLELRTQQKYQIHEMIPVLKEMGFEIDPSKLLKDADPQRVLSPAETVLYQMIQISVSRGETSKLPQDTIDQIHQILKTGETDIHSPEGQAKLALWVSYALRGGEGGKPLTGPELARHYHELDTGTKAFIQQCGIDGNSPLGKQVQTELMNFVLSRNISPTEFGKYLEHTSDIYNTLHMIASSLTGKPASSTPEGQKIMAGLMLSLARSGDNADHIHELCERLSDVEHDLRSADLFALSEANTPDQKLALLYWTVGHEVSLGDLVKIADNIKAGKLHFAWENGDVNLRKGEGVFELRPENIIHPVGDDQIISETPVPDKGKNVADIQPPSAAEEASQALAARAKVQASIVKSEPVEILNRLAKSFGISESSRFVQGLASSTATQHVEPAKAESILKKLNQALEATKINSRSFKNPEAVRQELFKRVVEGKITEAFAQTLFEKCHTREIIPEDLDFVLGFDSNGRNTVLLEAAPELGAQAGWLEKLVENPKGFHEKVKQVTNTEGRIYNLFNIISKGRELDKDEKAILIHNLEDAGFKIPAADKEKYFDGLISLIKSYNSLGLEDVFSSSDLITLMAALHMRGSPPVVSENRMKALEGIPDLLVRRQAFLKTLLQREVSLPEQGSGKAQFVDFNTLKIESDRVLVADSVMKQKWAKEALQEVQGHVLLADNNFGRKEPYLRVTDHHGVYGQEKNSTEQMIDLFEDALRKVGGESAVKNPSAAQVDLAIQSLNIREVATDNLADGGWCLWIAQNQKRILANPVLRETIRKATHFEDFSAFGNNYDRNDPAVRLQAALFKNYGDNLASKGIKGSDRFPPERAAEVVPEAMRDIDRLMTDPQHLEETANAFWKEVDAAKEVAKGAVSLERSVDGKRVLAFYDMSKLSQFSIFAQWLAVPDLQRTIAQADKLPLQATVTPMPPLVGPEGNISRTLPIIAIPNGVELPSGKGLLSVVKAINAAEAAKVEALKAEGNIPKDFKPNSWFGKDNVILPNPAAGGTLLGVEEIANILMKPEMRLFHDVRGEAKHLAEGSTPFAKAAKDFLSGKKSATQYYEAQDGIAKQMVKDHRVPCEKAISFLNSLSGDPSLNISREHPPVARMKAVIDIAPKLVRRGYTHDAALADIAATRIIVKSNTDVEAVIGRIQEKYPIRELYTKEGDMELDLMDPAEVKARGLPEIENEVWLDVKPDKDDIHRLVEGHPASGYRALHIVVEIDGKPVEIQIKTQAMHEWGEIEHKLVYKNKNLPDSVMEPIKAFRKAVADYLTKAEHLQSGETLGEMPKAPEIADNTPNASEIRKQLEAMTALMEKYTPAVDESQIPIGEAYTQDVGRNSPAEIQDIGKRGMDFAQALREGNEKDIPPSWIRNISWTSEYGKPFSRQAALLAQTAARNIPILVQEIRSKEISYRKTGSKEDKGRILNQLDDLYIRLDHHIQDLERWKRVSDGVTQYAKSISEFSFPYVRDSVRDSARKNMMGDGRNREFMPEAPLSPVSFDIERADWSENPDLRGNLMEAGFSGRDISLNDYSIHFTVSTEAERRSLVSFIKQNPENKTYRISSESPNTLRVRTPQGKDFLLEVHLASEIRNRVAPREEEALPLAAEAKPKPKAGEHIEPEAMVNHDGGEGDVSKNVSPNRSEEATNPGIRRRGLPDGSSALVLGILAGGAALLYGADAHAAVHEAGKAISDPGHLIFEGLKYAAGLFPVLGMFWGKGGGDKKSVPPSLEIKPNPQDSVILIGRKYGHFPNDTSVSGTHCTLYKTSTGQWVLQDGEAQAGQIKGSKNGVRILDTAGNETALPSGGRSFLQDGQVIIIGKSAFVFRSPDSAPLPQQSTPFASHDAAARSSVKPARQAVVDFTQYPSLAIPSTSNPREEFVIGNAVYEAGGGRVNHLAEDGDPQARVYFSLRTNIQGKWFVYDGRVGGSEKSPYGVEVMSASGERKKVNGFSELNPGDLIVYKTARGEFAYRFDGQIAETPPRAAAPRVVTPTPPATPRVLAVHDISQFTDLHENNPEWKSKQGAIPGVAFASHEGVGYKDHNEDRYYMINLGDGRTITFAIDGMGGQMGAEKAAAIIRSSLERAFAEGANIQEAIDVAKRTLRATNQPLVDNFIAKGKKAYEADPQLPGAVAVGVSTKPIEGGKFEAEFVSIGDAEAIVIRPSADGRSAPSIAFHTARPSAMNILLPDRKTPTVQDGSGRRQRNFTLVERLNPISNIVSEGLGLSSSDIHYDKQVLEKGDIIITGSDGFFENFGSFDEIAKVIQASGQKTPQGIRDTLMRETLLRQQLLKMRQSGEVLELTHEKYVFAYQTVFQQQAPAGWRGMYESSPSQRFVLDNNGNVGRWENIDPATHTLKEVNNIPQAITHFKRDNTTVGVQILGDSTPPVAEAKPVKISPPIQEAPAAKAPVGVSFPDPLAPRADNVHVDQNPTIITPALRPEKLPWQKVGGSSPYHSVILGRPAKQAGHSNPANLFPVNNQAISKRHAEIVVGADGTRWLRDLSYQGSSKGENYGTWVAEQNAWRKLAPGENYPLKTGQSFALGTLVEEGMKLAPNGIGLPSKKYNLDNAIVYILGTDGNTLFSNSHAISREDLPQKPAVDPVVAARAAIRPVPLKDLPASPLVSSGVRIEGKLNGATPIQDFSLQNISQNPDEPTWVSVAFGDQPHLVQGFPEGRGQPLFKVTSRNGKYYLQLAIDLSPVGWSIDGTRRSMGQQVLEGGKSYKITIASHQLDLLLPKNEASHTETPRPPSIQVGDAVAIPLETLVQPGKAVVLGRQGDVMLSDPRSAQRTVSKRHATILCDVDPTTGAYSYLLRDGETTRTGWIPSLSGTEVIRGRETVNIKDYEVQQGHPFALQEGDRVRLGGEPGIEFVWHDPPRRVRNVAFETLDAAALQRLNPALRQQAQFHEAHYIDGILANGLEIPGRSAVYIEGMREFAETPQDNGKREIIVWDRAKDKVVASFLSRVEAKIKSQLGLSQLDPSNPRYGAQMEAALKIFMKELQSEFQKPGENPQMALHRLETFANTHPGEKVLLGNILQQKFPYCRHLTLITQAFLSDLGVRDVRIQRGFGGGGAHVWNEVNINGQRRIVEPTWAFWGTQATDIIHPPELTAIYHVESRPGKVR